MGVSVIVPTVSETLRLVLALVAIGLLALEAFPGLLARRPSWVHFGWLGLALLAVLLLF